MDNDLIKVAVTVWVGFIFVVLTGFGLMKLGSNLFNFPSAPQGAKNDSSECWTRGGVPQYDTKGADQNFKDCVFKEEVKK